MVRDNEFPMEDQAPKSHTYLLLLILFTGLILRLWGITWGLYSGTALHPDEAGDCPLISRIIQGDFSKSGLGEVYYYVYYYCTAIVFMVIRKITYLIGIIFSIYRVESEINLDMVLIGRITSVVFSTLNIWLIYFLGKKIFQKSQIGLMAAVILTVTPLAVAQAHYLETDSPLAFMATLSFLFSYLILTRKNSLYFALGGLFYGLTITTKPNGILIIIPFLISFIYLYFDESFKCVRISLLKRILLFLATAITGFSAGAPGLFVNFSEIFNTAFGKTLEMAKFKYLPWNGPWIEGPQGSKFAWAIQTLQDGFGILFIIIFLVGTIYYLLRKNKAALLTCSFPVGYFFIVGLWGRRFGERDVVVMIPFLALMVAAIIYNLFQDWYPWRYKNFILSLCFIGLLTWPIWKTVEVDYYYWLDDNRDLAEKWINQNLPSKSIVAMDGYTPYTIDFPTIDFEYLQPIQYYNEKSDYVVTSTLEGDRYFSLWTNKPIRPEGENLLRLQHQLTLIKEFDLKYQDTESEKNGSIKFPDFLDPIIKVYSTKANPSKHRISFPVLNVDAFKPFKVVFLNHPEYGKKDDVIVARPNSEIVRVLKSRIQLKNIQLILYGDKEADATIELGRSKKEIKISPGQIEIFDMEPTPSFPFIKNIYPLKVRSQSTGNVYVRWSADPVEIGLNWLHNNQPLKAVHYFEIAHQKNPEDLENLGFLGVAYYETGRIEEALKKFEEIKKRDPTYLSHYYDLAKNTLPVGDWLKRFGDFTNLYMPLVKNKSTNNYIFPEQCTFPEKLIKFSKGNLTSIYDKGDDGLNFFKSWDHNVYPPGFFRINFQISTDSSVRGDIPALRVDILKHTDNGWNKMAEQVVFTNQIKQDNGSGQDISLAFTNDFRMGHQFEFRVFSLHEKVKFKVKQIDVYVDIQKSMEENIKTILFALAKTYQTQSKYESAIETYQRIFDLSPGHHDVCWRLGNLLLQTGDRQRGLFFLKKDEELNENNQGRLKALLDLYHKISEPLAAKRVQEKINGLPSPPVVLKTNFSNKIELMGYSLEEKTFKKGETIRGFLYWKGIDKMDRDYEAFIHVVKGGQIFFQGNTSPQDKGILLKSLLPGEIIKQNFQIKIPSESTSDIYEIYLGLWDSQYSGKRLKINFPNQYENKDKIFLSNVKIH